jgi:hypothetical protein
MEIVAIKSIQYSGQRKVNINDEDMQVETFSIVFDDKGVDKLAIVACKPEHGKTVGKALLKRLAPLRFKEIDKPVIKRGI